MDAKYIVLFGICHHILFRSPLFPPLFSYGLLSKSRHEDTAFSEDLPASSTGEGAGCTHAVCLILPATSNSNDFFGCCCWLLFQQREWWPPKQPWVYSKSEVEDIVDLHHFFVQKSSLNFLHYGLRRRRECMGSIGRSVRQSNHTPFRSFQVTLK